MQILTLEAIKKRISTEKAYEAIKVGFADYLAHKFIQPSPANLELQKGSLHIKYGMKKGDSHFFVKLATGFAENWKKALPTGDGCILAFNSDSGLFEFLLQDIQLAKLAIS